MALSSLLLVVLGLGACAVMVVVIIGVVWAIANERKKSSNQ